MPRATTHKREIYIMLQELDAKRWIIARETGTSGYEHWQCRCSVSGNLGEWIRRQGLNWYFDTANEVWDYEQKTGDYWCSWDSVQTRILRYGRLTPLQRTILRSVDSQSVRMVTIWIDPQGGNGKSWLFLHGILQGRVLPVPAYGISAKRLSGWLHSAYRGQPIIWIDIPRAQKIDTDLWSAIEEAKQIVYDWRYHSEWTITYGVKILVTCNNYLTKENYKALSKDRWDVHVIKPTERGTEP